MQNHLDFFCQKTQFWNRFLRNTIFSTIVVFDIHTAFFDGFNVFFRFLAEIRFRTPIKSPQKATSRPMSCKFRTTCTLPGRMRTLPWVTVCSLLKNYEFFRKDLSSWTAIGQVILSGLESFVKFGTCFCFFDMAMLAMPINGNGARQDCNACMSVWPARRLCLRWIWMARALLV